VLLVVALLAGTVLGLLVLNTAIAVDSLEASRLRADNAQRAQEVQRLEQRVVDGNTPAAIAAAAVQAGLVPAGPAAYLVLDPDGSPVLRGEPAPAEPAPAEPAPVPAPADGPAGGN
jgi:type II secretory pathway pseudopilin PulG